MGRHEEDNESIGRAMKIALIYPAITLDGFAKDNKRPKTGWIHHGLANISAALKNKGHAVSLIDLRQMTGWEELPPAIKAISPDIVGITMMSLDFDAAVKAAEIAKDIAPGTKVVVGGAHPSLMESELIGIRVGDSYTNLVFRKWNNLAKELGHDKGHIILHAAEKDSDIFRSENLHYIRISFQNHKKEVSLEIIDNPLDL